MSLMSRLEAYTMADRKKKQFGIEGLGDLAGFLSKILELAEKADALKKSKNFEGKGYKGEYHFNISTVKREAPSRAGVGIRPGYKPSKVEKPELIKPEFESKEQLLDVFDKGDHILVVASLPNIKEEDLEFEIVDKVLRITAKTTEGKIEKDISIPDSSEVDEIEKASVQNGILEIKLSKKRGH